MEEPTSAGSPGSTDFAASGSGNPPLERKSMRALVKNAELARLRRYLLPILTVRSHRRRRARARLNDPPLRPSPADLARHIASTTLHFAKWPLDVLTEMCANPIYGFAQPGEPLAYDAETAKTFGLILVLRGRVGITHRDPAGAAVSKMRKVTTAAIAAQAMRLAAQRAAAEDDLTFLTSMPSIAMSASFSPRPVNGDDSSGVPPPRDANAPLGQQHAAMVQFSEPFGRQKGLGKDLPVDDVTLAPCTKGELLCLTDGMHRGVLRALELTDYAIINVSAIRLVISSRLSPEVLNQTFCKEVRMARKSVVAEHFRQTAPLIASHWVCADMSPAEHKMVVEALEVETFLPGQDIVTEGASGSTMYFIRRGTAQVFVKNTAIKTKEGKFVLYPPGSAFGEMAVLFQEKRMATVRAVDVCDAWVLRKAALDKVLRHSSEVKARVIATAAAKRTGMVASLPREHVLAALEKHSVYRKLPPPALQELVAQATPRVFPAGTLMISAAMMCNEMIAIQNGSATSQDVFSVHYERGDLIGDLCLCPHRSIETVAANTMVDAFVFHRTLLMRVLKRHGFVAEAMSDCEARLQTVAHRKGVTANILITKAVAPIPHLVIPTELTQYRPPNASPLSTVVAPLSPTVASGNAVKTPQAPLSPTTSAISALQPQPQLPQEERTARLKKRDAAPSHAFRRRTKYAQPEPGLQRDACMVLHATLQAQAAATKLLGSRDAAATFEAPQSVALLARLRRNKNRHKRKLARQRRERGSGGESNGRDNSDDDDDDDGHSSQNNDLTDTDNADARDQLFDAVTSTMPVDMITPDFMETAKWRENHIFRDLMAQEGFRVQLCYMPSKRHLAYIAISIRAMLARKLKSVPSVAGSGGPKTQSPLHSQPSSRATSAKNLKSGSGVSVAEKAARIAAAKLCATADDRSAARGRCGAGAGGAGELRPMYRAINPNGYNVVLPLCVQPPTAGELAAELGDASQFEQHLLLDEDMAESEASIDSPRRRRRPTANSITSLNSTLTGAHHHQHHHGVVPPGAAASAGTRRYMPSHEETDELMAELLGHVTQADRDAANEDEIRQQRFGNRTRDYVGEAWEDLNGQIPIEKPIETAIYPKPVKPKKDTKGGFDGAAHPGNGHRGGPSALRRKQSLRDPARAAGVVSSQSESLEGTHRDLKQIFSSTVEGRFESSMRGTSPNRLSPEGDVSITPVTPDDAPDLRSPRGQPHVPGSHHRAKPPPPAPFGLPARPPTLHDTVTARRRLDRHRLVALHQQDASLPILTAEGALEESGAADGDDLVPTVYEQAATTAPVPTAAATTKALILHSPRSRSELLPTPSSPRIPFAKAPHGDSSHQQTPLPALQHPAQQRALRESASRKAQDPHGFRVRYVPMAAVAPLHVAAPPSTPNTTKALDGRSFAVVGPEAARIAQQASSPLSARSGHRRPQRPSSPERRGLYTRGFAAAWAKQDALQAQRREAARAAKSLPDAGEVGSTTITVAIASLQADDEPAGPQRPTSGSGDVHVMGVSPGEQPVMGPPPLEAETFTATDPAHPA
jgi:CRP-like cAMP-binding protein